ncbi:hypothetical protein KI387_019439 [Taxus chinensis]|uniref:Enoyl reductase (ER) domain-containing protein n=1 Tax=Taxus chinensis TaxID=29808 RepID=A0AA38G9H4_TAXCH|nr:hypothetical protein KI387_019439 [Taxus chinensis]
MGEKRFDVQGWAADDESGVLSPFNFTRRKTGPNDVTFRIVYCGICHTDLHILRNEWHNSKYPLVPGHEIVGIVTEVGSEVQKFGVGDRVGVGCMVRSCHSCDPCEKGLEQFCDKVVLTYNGIDIDGSTTYGGYSSLMPHDILWNERAREPSWVVGLGGIGHMAVKFGKAFGLHVTVISTSPKKEKEAKEILGADHFLISKDENQMKEAAKTLDYIIDTVSADHPPAPFAQFAQNQWKAGRKFVGGSSIGGIKETQEMMDFCAEHKISCTIEKIPIDYVNTAIERLVKGDVKYRFVIDNAESFRGNSKWAVGHYVSNIGKYADTKDLVSGACKIFMSRGTHEIRDEDTPGIEIGWFLE